MEPPHIVTDTGLQVASLLDLAGIKASVVQQRALARAYVDIDALMRLGSINLPTALAAAQKIFGPSFNAMITLKALTYFGDAGRAVYGSRLWVCPMNPIPITPLTLEVARRVVWFEPPERALANPVQFMAYAMTYATHEDMQVIRRYVSDDDFREVLDNAPAGIIDARSWAYWNLKMGRYPAPPLPRRKIGDLTVEPQAWPPQRGSTGGVDRGPPLSAEEVQEQARAGWQQMRQQDSQLDAEEMRRQAQEEWRARYGSKEDKD